MDLITQIHLLLICLILNTQCIFTTHVHLYYFFSLFLIFTLLLHTSTSSHAASKLMFIFIHFIILLVHPSSVYDFSFNAHIRALNTTHCYKHMSNNMRYNYSAYTTYRRCCINYIQYFSIDNAHLMYNAHPRLFRHSF
jgi:hypothetical protein